ncbi:hypothetical protein ABZ553_19830 [Streptomyces sparsogenes]|uniref:hypothetical protein n=1 Tax=Streptomyces sparsogenes TaxID=67365 RepID=UPI0033FAEE68
MKSPTVDDRLGMPEMPTTAAADQVDGGPQAVLAREHRVEYGDDATALMVTRSPPVSGPRRPCTLGAWELLVQLNLPLR